MSLNENAPAAAADNSPPSLLEETGSTVETNGVPQLALSPEDYPDISNLITEDDTPLDSIFTERQQKLLTEPLHSSWGGPPDGTSFVALANVGLFFSVRNPPLVPDCLLSLDVELSPNLREKEHQSYLVWVFEKFPDAVLEIVSDRRGGEDSFKLQQYARHRIPYYVIYDPDNLLDGGVLRVLELHGRKYKPVKNHWLSEVGLGLTLWEGSYGGAQGQWLRWCERDGRLIPTGCERADQEKHRADQAEQRVTELAEEVKRLEAQLRKLRRGRSK